MRKLVLFAGLFLLVSCTSSKKNTTAALNSWIGSTKQSLILSWGPPSQTTSDGNKGEVLVYSRHVYYMLYNASQPVDYWEYRMMYVNEDGIIYHWLIKKNPNPPDRIDVRLLTY